MELSCTESGWALTYVFAQPYKEARFCVYGYLPNHCAAFDTNVKGIYDD